MHPLADKRILVVEDEALIAMMVADMLDNAGATIVGPAFTVPSACALISAEKIDAAVVDVNLGGVRSEQVADLLAQRQIPFVIASGYGDVGDKFPPSVPLLQKPYLEAELVRHVLKVLASRNALPMNSAS